MKRIAALVPNKLGVSPGQRQRIESWAPLLENYRWQVDFFPFEDESLNDVIYKKGHLRQKVLGLASSYVRQTSNVLNRLNHDGLFIYREASLIGPAILESLAKRSGMPMIYDLDDPIFLPYASPVNGWFSLLKFSRKTHSLFRLSNRVIAINSLIGDYAKKYNPSVSVVPNLIDTDLFHPNETFEPEGVSIVWTGSVSTLRNLNSVSNVLRRVQEKYDVKVKIVANGKTEIDGVHLEHHEWSPETEIACLQNSSIGIVPLLDLEWNPWKFYLKTVQYCAAGIPVVARNIGSNSEVIEDGVNGFLVETEDDWVERLGRLIESAEMRRRMGIAARETAVKRFSLKTQIERVAQIFSEVYGGPA